LDGPGVTILALTRVGTAGGRHRYRARSHLRAFTCVPSGPLMI
jgi:hypothetical protein